MERLYYVTEGARYLYSDGKLRRGFFVRRKGVSRAVDFCESESQANEICDRLNKQNSRVI